MRIGIDIKGRVVGAAGTDYSKGAFYAIVIMILMCFQPSKAIGYAAPYVFVFLVVILAPPVGLVRRVIVWIATWGFLWLFYLFIEGWFQVQSFILSFVTYSSFAILLIPTRFFSPALYAKLRRFLLPFLILQSAIGVVQAAYNHFLTGSFDSKNGDIVRGTMAGTLGPDDAATNSMFTISIIYILLALFPIIVARRRGYSWLALGIFCVILASVMHATIFAVVAIGFATCCVSRRPLKTIIPLTVVIAVVFGLVSIFLPGNLKNLGDFRDQFLAGVTPKAELYLTSFGVLPQQVPRIVVVGLGPGQFSSRAAMISTGEYLSARQGGAQVPLLRNRVPKYTGIYELPLWDQVESVNWNGSTQTCFASWASVPTEFGFLFMLTLLGWTLNFILRISTRIRRASNRLTLNVRCEAISLISGVTFLFLLGFQENYWEMPQAILLGLVLMRFMYATIIMATPDVDAQFNSWTVRRQRLMSRGGGVGLATSKA